VLASSDRPFGKVGDTDQEVTVPPWFVGVPEENAESLVSVNGLPAYSITDGATSFTVKVTIAVVDPPVLVAVTVMSISDVTAVGVPENSPVLKSKLIPEGMPMETVQPVIGPPDAVSEWLGIGVPTVRIKLFGL
jgi:hypothetical protein